MPTLTFVNFTGPRNAREAVRHFGPAPGVPHSHTKYVFTFIFQYFNIFIGKSKLMSLTFVHKEIICKTIHYFIDHLQ